jgi:hypothetical protein
MKRAMKILCFTLLAAGGVVLLAGNAIARISMPEREHVQAIVWAGEFISLVTAVAIAVFVWRISKRDSKNKKSKQDASNKH